MAITYPIPSTVAPQRAAKLLVRCLRDLQPEAVQRVRTVFADVASLADVDVPQRCGLQRCQHVITLDRGATRWKDLLVRSVTSTPYDNLVWIERKPGAHVQFGVIGQVMDRFMTAEPDGGDQLAIRHATDPLPYRSDFVSNAAPWAAMDVSVPSFSLMIGRTYGGTWSFAEALAWAHANPRTNDGIDPRPWAVAWIDVHATAGYGMYGHALDQNPDPRIRHATSSDWHDDAYGVGMITCMLPAMNQDTVDRKAVRDKAFNGLLHLLNRAHLPDAPLLVVVPYIDELMKDRSLSEMEELVRKIRTMRHRGISLVATACSITEPMEQLYDLAHRRFLFAWALQEDQETIQRWSGRSIQDLGPAQWGRLGVTQALVDVGHPAPLIPVCMRLRASMGGVNGATSAS
jgi:hypothetical protein